MEFVLISGQYQRLLKFLEQIEKVDITKIQRAKIFFSCDDQNIIQEIKLSFKEKIALHNCVYEIYQIKNGIIDLAPYLSEETKNKMNYYQKENNDDC